MSGHAIRWEFDTDSVHATAVCHEPADADCHLTSVSCECEQWGEIRRRDDGTIWHRITESNGIEPEWHEVKVADDCNVCLFINEPGFPMELGRGQFVIGETPIRPLWDFDGCEWEPIETTNRADAAEAKLAAIAKLCDLWDDSRARNGRPMLTTANVVDRLRGLLDQDGGE